MIYSQAEGGGAASLSGGEVEGLKLRDIVTAIEHLRNRAVEAESKNAETLSELSRTMGGFVERQHVQAFRHARRCRDRTLPPA
ncbi:MAG: hypothetical protein AAFW81_12915, partial [Pseudomonadota bacterium]